jgi:hypothetical protein
MSMKVKLVRQICRPSPVHPHLAEEVFRLLLPTEEVFGKNIMEEKYLVVTLRNPDSFVTKEAFVTVFVASEDMLGSFECEVVTEEAELNDRVVQDVKKMWQSQVRVASNLFPVASKLFSDQRDLAGYKEASPKTALSVSASDEVTWNESRG